MPVIHVFDTVGEIFAVVRDLDLGVPIRRVPDYSRSLSGDRPDLAVVAAYGSIQWDVAAPVGPSDTLVVSARFDADEAFAALERGFAGYLDAATQPSALRAAVLGCLAGEPGFGRVTVGRWLRACNTVQHSHESEARLTSRQREVLGLVARGLADKEIGKQLGIATVTAQKHVTNILDRLEVPNRAAAVAAVCGLIALTPVGRMRSRPTARLAAAS